MVLQLTKIRTPNKVGGKVKAYVNIAIQSDDNETTLINYFNIPIVTDKNGNLFPIIDIPARDIDGKVVESRNNPGKSLMQVVFSKEFKNAVVNAYNKAAVTEEAPKRKPKPKVKSKGTVTIEEL